MTAQGCPMMKEYVFGVVMSFAAAVVLFAAGSRQISNLETSIPAILCFIAGFSGAMKIRNEMRK